MVTFGQNLPDLGMYSITGDGKRTLINYKHIRIEWR